MARIEPGLFDMIMRLRGRGISDTSVLRAMERVPRSDFVGMQYVPQAYDECDLPISCGQNLPAPLTLAILCQTLEVLPEHKILQIGTGSGYTAAILAGMGKRVYTVERYQTLVGAAEPVLSRHAPNAVPKFGDGRYGWRGQAPFDRILLTTSVRKPPAGLLDQLKPGGRLVAVMGEMLAVFDKTGKEYKETKILPMKLPVIEAGKARAL